MFLGALDQLHGNFSDIGAHQDYQKPNCVMPELLIKELCPGLEEGKEEVSRKINRSLNLFQDKNLSNDLPCGPAAVRGSYTG